MMKRRRNEARPVSIAGYDVLERIGTGGFAVVYRARQTSMNREVAIKVLNAGFADESERRTFERECHALGRLSHHPHIVTVFNDAFTDDGRPCIVMELYRSNYRQRVDEPTPVPVAEVVAVGIKMAGALQAAHDEGVLHRDIKPHNIFISHFGEPALGDFGISTLDDERSQSASSGLSLAYAAPEVLEDSPADRSSDVYSLAASLYHLANGSSPFASNELRTTVRRILTEAPPPISRADVPAGLTRVLLRSMAKDPSERPPTARDLAEMLREVEGRSRLGTTPMGPGAGGNAATPAAPSAGPLIGPAPHGATSIPPVVSVAPGAMPATAPSPGAMPVPFGHDGAPGFDAPPDRDGMTIARARERAVPPPVEDDAPDRTRFWVGIGVAAVVVAGLGVGGVMVASGGDDDTGTTATVGASVDVPLVVLEPPSKVDVAPNDERGFDVTWDPPEGADTIVIEVTSPTERGTLREVDADRGRTSIRIAGNSLCVTLRAQREDGRVSDTTDAICS